MALLPDLTKAELDTLKGKSVIVTGGASGIGRAAIKLAHDHGANVTIADVTVEAGEKYAAELKDRAIFVKTDVTSWDSIINLFETAYAKFGPIDVVCGNAGIAGFDNLLDDEIDETSGKLKAPVLKSIDVNLVGAIYTSKAAVHYFAKHPEKQGSLVLTGSAASLIDNPPVFLYCAAKTGVLGLMRGLRSQLPLKYNCTINMVAPWMTITPMLPQWIIDLWGDLPANSPEGPAHALLLPAVRPGTNGKGLWVAGNKVIEFEEQMHRAQTQWLGEKLSEEVDAGQRLMIPGWSETVEPWKHEKK